MSAASTDCPRRQRDSLNAPSYSSLSILHLRSASSLLTERFESRRGIIQKYPLVRIFPRNNARNGAGVSEVLGPVVTPHAPRVREEMDLVEQAALLNSVLESSTEYSIVAEDPEGWILA